MQVLRGEQTLEPDVESAYLARANAMNLGNVSAGRLGKSNLLSLAV